jgi:polyisoprenyl-phosphate glycosyltransferase
MTNAADDKFARTKDTDRTFCAVIAMCDEAPNIAPLVERLNTVFTSIPGNMRILFIDDGSTDASVDKVLEAGRQHGNVDLIKLSRNFGHHTALLAGLDHAVGDIFFLMDADLQDRPEDLPRLIQAYDDGYDLVYAIRQQRIESTVRRFGSGIFWWMVNQASDAHCPPNQAVMRLFGPKVRNAVVQMRERHNFLAGMFAWVGFRHAAIEVEQAERLHGETKYSMTKILRQTLNAITSFSMKPLRLMVYFGTFVAFIAIASAFYLLIDRLTGGDFLPGWSSIMVALFFSLGVQMIGLGLVGEYVGRIFEQTKSRPEYVIDQISKSGE